MSSSRGFSLKDQLFNVEKIRYLAGLFDGPNFDGLAFEERVMQRMLSLELMQRIVWIAEVFEEFLPDDFSAAAAVIVSALPPPLDPDKSDDDFGDFIFAPLGEYTARQGLADLSVSLPLLEELTKRFSVEFPIRHFLNAHPEQTMVQMALWARAPNYHLRRLASEGTRPTLPWGVKVGIASDAGLPLLDQLYGDATRYVTRSVANHLNDLAKKQPDLVVATLARWQDEGRQEGKEMRWIASHALRTLVKRGHKGALELLGFRAAPQVTLGEIDLVETQVVIGQALEFSCDITATRDEKLMVDFVIDFVKADGSRKSRVFKLKQMGIRRGETLTLRKKHRFLGNATTFKVFPGEHRLSLQVNGTVLARADFGLLAA